MVEKINMIKWRRAKVLELNSQGHNQSEIARVMQDGISTIHRDSNVFNLLYLAGLCNACLRCCLVCIYTYQ